MTKILLAGESGTLEKTVNSMKDSKNTVEEFYAKGIKLFPAKLVARYRSDGTTAVRPSNSLKKSVKKHIFSTESEQYLDVDGERFPYKHMEITPTESRLNVIGGSHFYDL